MKEIERKFLVNKSLVLKTILSTEFKTIQQAYIAETDTSTIRVRTKGNKGFLTIKGNTLGITRSEFEYEIPFKDALSLIKTHCTKSIFKDRYTTTFEGKIWEVDLFHGHLEGLILAEIELKSEDEYFTLPSWVEKEVSYDERYFNSKLIHLKLDDLSSH